jgi:hypothetical protein
MGHPQSRTPIQTGTLGDVVINNRVQPKQLKEMDMRIHWLKYCKAQGQFKIHLQLGKTNLANYFTKHHAPTHYTNIRSEFLTHVKDLVEARSQKATQGQTKPTNQGIASYKGVLNLLYKHIYSKPTIS